MHYIIFLPVLTLIILIYFRYAVKFDIIDKPNHRSSHHHTTIRGGGIVFPIAVLLQGLLFGFDYHLFTSGLLLISLVSFLDDLYSLPNKIRLFVHLTAVSLLLIEAGIMGQPILTILICYVLVIGTINAWNFMDGINGITGTYSLVTVTTLYVINRNIIFFALPEVLLVTILALLVFNFFNFRTKAKCFAGDVGSVSIAFIIIFFLLLLILKTGELKYTGLLLFYGLDAVTTIIFRLFRRENIFKAHRSHFYQYLANFKSWPHLMVSCLYMLLQLLINIFIIGTNLTFAEFLLFCFISGLVFVGIRLFVEGRQYLIHPKTKNEH